LKLATIVTALAAAAVLVAGAMLAAACATGSDATGPPTPTRTATPRGTPTAQPTPVPPPAQPAPAQGPGIMVTECRGTTDHSVRAIFLWNPSRAGTQWLDLSVLNDGFAPATFVSAGPLGSQFYGYVWDGLLEGTTHFARVNTLTRAGWMPSQTLSFYTPVCDGGASSPAPAADMLRLRENMAAAIASSGINTAVAITDLRTGETVDVNGNDNRLPGCTINLFVLFRVVVDLQAGKYPEATVGDTIGQTINRSDPILARRLMINQIGDGNEATGITRVNDFLHALGMTSTLMDHPPAFEQESLFGLSDNRITALDAVHGLKAIWEGRVLTPGWRDYFLQKMTLVKPGLNYLIPAGVGPGATVSHKNGFLYSEGWADNDVGIVWFQRGAERYGYAITFYTQGVASKYADIPMGQRISSLAWQWLVARYGYP
jgi:beta-lactamase class A